MSWITDFVDTTVNEHIQCWGCSLFDRLFQIVSQSASVVYDKLVFICTGLFAVLLAFYVLSTVWQNIKGGVKDPMYTKSVQKVVINALVALSLLNIGVALPRFVTTVTFEPIAQVALSYTEGMLKTTSEHTEQRVSYTPMQMRDDGFYRPQLRDTILLMMMTTVSQFQSYIKLGVAIIDASFEWDSLLKSSDGFLLGLGNILKHVIIFFIGIALTWQFFKLFFRFCCKFVDIIIAMTFFAFFFPISLILTPFKGLEGVPAWISALGKSLGIEQFKSLVNAIISLVATVITYTIIIILVSKFFSSNAVSVEDLMAAITSGDVFKMEFSMDSIYAMTFGNCIVLLFVMNWVYDQIGQVTTMILNAFNVKDDAKIGEGLANGLEGVTKNIFNATASAGSKVINAIKGDKS